MNGNWADWHQLDLVSYLHMWCSLCGYVHSLGQDLSLREPVAFAQSQNLGILKNDIAA